MPFSQRVIRTRDDIETIIMDQKNPNVLEKAVVSNMIGLLGQLNDLSNFAVEIFGDILKQTEVQTKRIGEARGRIRSLEEKVPGVEKRLVDNAPSYFYDNPYMDKEYARKDRPKGFLFRRDRSTIEVNRRRGLADAPPDLSLMDRFSPSGPCIKLFSDSEFFLNEWLVAEKLRVEEEKRRRKAKKAERKAKRAARTKDTKSSSGGKRRIERVKKKVYSKHGAEYQADVKQVDDYIEIDERTIPKTQSTYDDVAQTDHSGKRDSVKPTATRGVTEMKSRATATSPAKTAAGAGAGVAMASAARPTATATPATTAAVARPGPGPAPGTTGPPPTTGISATEGGGPPPVTAAMTGGPPAHYPPGPDGSAAAAAVPPRAPIVIDPMSIELAPEEKTLEMRLAESRRMAEEQAAIDEARRQRLAIEQEKAKKLAPVSSSASLMAAIRGGGHQLRRAEPIKREVKKDARSMMLESIAGGARGLKKVDREAEAAKRAAEREAEQEDNTIFAALNARRGLLADDSDDDSDFESSSGWDSD